MFFQFLKDVVIKMIKYDFYLFKRSGELLLNISNHNLMTKPVLIASFLSALNTFSHEVNKSGIDIIVLGDKAFLMAETNELILAMYVLEKENLTRIRTKLQAMVRYLQQAEKRIPNQLVAAASLDNVKRELISIIETTTPWFSESEVQKITGILDELLIGTQVDGYLLMSQDGSVIMSENISSEDKIKIMRQIETLGSASEKDNLSGIIFLYDSGKQIFVKFLKHFAIALRVRSKIYLGLVSNVTETTLQTLFEKIDTSLSEVFSSGKGKF